MKTLAKQIRKFLKNEKINAQVKVMGEIIVIDNIGGQGWAQNIAEAATGLKFEHMTQSMTKLAK